MAKAPDHVRTSDRTKFLGCLPNDPSKPRVKLTVPHGAKLTPPASAGWYSTVNPGAWGVLGNDTVGDCVAAGAFHGQQLWEEAAQNRETVFTSDEALAMYSAISGYNPKKPNTDVGATLQSGLDYWRKTGLGPQSFKISAFAEFDYRNTDLLKQLIADMGVVYLALEVPASAMTQYDQGQPWTVVPRSRIEGGHCVPGVGYDANYLYVITWGSVQPVAWPFVSKYFDESWAPVSPDWMTSSGKTPSGFDSTAANAAYQQLTGDTAAPFPAVTPTPTPDPTPTPAPSGDAVALLTSLQTNLNADSAQIAAFLAANAHVPPHHGH